ncbi:S1C family serine protease [Anaerobacillus sp. MEB173]|uniref:S1C family serine protease n=1 Tax=Anaerobacillus sp. MEB173 TaxID=3383345 RepID=UPI003F8DD8BB
MGYYDEQNQRYNENQRKKGRGVGFGLSAFIGSTVGALLVILSVPTLAQNGLLPYNVTPKTQEDIVIEQPKTPDGLEQTVNLSVNSDVIEAVDRVSDAVVGVVNLRESNFWSQTNNEGTGSGVIYKKENGKAFVVTNHHVIENANEIEVSLSDGSRVPAKLLGSDILTDLAVLQIDGENIDTVAEFGNSDTLRVGEPAIAIGNPLGLQFSGSVTQGIISALERSIPVDLNRDGQVDWHAEVIQTDAAINPGNSGGALINIQGQVIGINSMKIAQSAVEGIGFSIPTAIAVPIIEDLELYGEVRRPQIGVGIRSLSEIPSYHWQETLKLPEEVKTGIFITSIAPMSPADQAGLKEYDVIVAIDDQELSDSHDLRKYLYTHKKIGDEVKVTFYREGKKQTVTLALSEQNSF